MNNFPLQYRTDDNSQTDGSFTGKYPPEFGGLDIFFWYVRTVNFGPLCFATDVYPEFDLPHVQQ